MSNLLQKRCEEGCESTLEASVLAMRAVFAETETVCLPFVRSVWPQSAFRMNSRLWKNKTSLFCGIKQDYSVFDSEMFTPAS